VEIKTLMKHWYKYFVYLSLLFLAVALYYADYLKVPKLISFPAILASLVFLFLGFISGAVAWKKILEKSHYHVDLSECLAGTGLSIFGKYIPGKIWLIVGRAAYIAEKSDYSLGRLSTISLNAQFIDLWIGLFFGMIGLLLLGRFHIWSWLVLFVLLGLTAVIFSKLVYSAADRLVKILLKKDVKITNLTIKSTVSVMPWFSVTWVFWSIGFYILVVSLTAIDVPWSCGFGFPLASTLGIMTLVTPGGLGTREGVMVGYLTLAGIPVTEATTMAVASRLWFLAGEVFIFSVGWVAKKVPHNAIYKLGS
jgi:uncharacterized membrane protein YbhN (UPF0104 family)